MNLGFVTLLGNFQAAWEHPAKTEGNGGVAYKISWSTPQNTTGTVILPALNGDERITLDGQVPEKNHVQQGTLAGKRIVTMIVTGGRHVLVVK